jgi:type II secretory pathway component PulC
MKLTDLSLPSEFSRRSMIILCVSTLCLIFITVLYSMWQWQGDWKLAHQTMFVPVIVKTTEPDIIALISENPIFGQSPKLGDMPITNLQLRVTGIVKTNNQHASKAYLSISGQLSKIVKVGDHLPDGVKIYDISKNAVVLENNGRLEKLPLPREKLVFKKRQNEDFSL